MSENAGNQPEMEVQVLSPAPPMEVNVTEEDKHPEITYIYIPKDIDDNTVTVSGEPCKIGICDKNCEECKKIPCG